MLSCCESRGEEQGSIFACGSGADEHTSMASKLDLRGEKSVHNSGHLAGTIDHWKEG